ncbi:MAG: transporter substrate-binding protein [Paenibacillus sp.]|jgi:multiple sugar transport system substrate-binding protein|nr:transporter substrate-binding protein [Paenibacillus sp.]
MKKQFIFTLAVCAFLAGCSSGKQAGDTSPTAPSDGKAPRTTAEKQEPKLSPVTIKLFNAANTTQSTFEKYMKAPVEKKYPHITLELVPNVQGSTLAELINGNQLPDMVYGKVNDTNKVMIDLAPLVAKFKFDLKTIKPRVLEYYKYLTGASVTQFIPYQTNQHVLHYNKGIFDRFGVEYPKDGMTWDAAYELARKMSRTDNGTKIMGFNFRQNLNFSDPQLQVEYYDVKTGKSALNSTIWNRYFENYARFFKIPGNELTKGKSELNNDNVFIAEQRVAMYASHPMLTNLMDANNSGNSIDWDLASYPYFPEAPKQGTAPNTNGLGITVASKHQDDAFRVIEALVSEEVQTLRAREIVAESVLVNDAKARADLGKGTIVDKKNKAALFYNEYSPGRSPNPFNTYLSSYASQAFVKVVEQGVDINTALREADDLANKRIDEEIAKGTVKR